MRTKAKTARLLERAERRRLAAEEIRIIARREAEAVALGLAETVALAQARGERVEADTAGPIRMNDRDGLQNLIEAGRLNSDTPGETQARVEAADAVRKGYEARSADLGSQMGAIEGVGGAGHDNDAFVLARLTRAKTLQSLGRIEFAVAVQCRDDPNCLFMLRRVAGQGIAISAFGTRGRDMDRNVAALVRALDVACAVLGKG